MNGTLLQVIADATNCEAINTQRYCFESISVPRIEYDEIVGRPLSGSSRYAETYHAFGGDYMNLKDQADECARKGMRSCPIRYFMDGTRKTYKIGDIRVGGRIYPVLAGQIVVGWTERENGNIVGHDYIHSIVICLPDSIHDFIEDKRIRAWAVNKRDQLNCEMKKFPWGCVSISDVLLYKTCQDADRNRKMEDLAISKIHSYMLDKEKETVIRLVDDERLSDKNYLIKDGSLEYQHSSSRSSDSFSPSMFHKSNYGYVVGASKSFNPESIINKAGRTDHNIVAKLPAYSRTRVYRYSDSRFDDDVEFGVWYVRIREKIPGSSSPFDGVLKLERILTTDDEIKNGFDSDEINTLTAHIINERNPVCYASDSRWANHIYPMYLTERYLKNKLINSNTFVHIF